MYRRMQYEQFLETSLEGYMTFSLILLPSSWNIMAAPGVALTDYVVNLKQRLHIAVTQDIRILGH